MDNKDEKYKDLIERYLKGEVSEEEARLINSSFNHAVEKQEDLGKVKGAFKVKKRVWRAITPSAIQPSRIFKLRYLSGIVAAAVVLVIGLWYFNYSPTKNSNETVDFVQQDIAPGGFGATLTRADGRQISLDSAKRGAVISDRITYEDGSVILDDQQLQGEAIEYFTASTCIGQVYTFVLPDGTKVWLNAESKLRFPSSFAGVPRKVHLEGEAYFEVRHDNKKHFFVESRGQLVEDLGTSFNISSYASDAVQATTLVEGAVRVNEVSLLPGQQALRSDNKAIQVVEADIDQVLAWQQGNFVFRGETLETVFKAIARWYAVDVVFEREHTKAITVGGTISRSRSIRAVLDLMERTGKVKCTIHGKQVRIR